MSFCTSKLWLENPLNLFCDYRLIPKEKESIEKNMNSITRLVIIICLILFLVGFKHTILFLLISLLMIIILYYMQRMYKQTSEQYPGFYVGAVTPVSSYSPIADQNQRYAGPPNPKTLVKPVVITPCYDIERRDSSRNVPRGINSRTVQYLYDSGFIVRDQECPESVESSIPAGSYTPYSNTPAGAYPSTGSYPAFSEDVKEGFYIPNSGCGLSPKNSQVRAPVNVLLSEKDSADASYNDRIYTQYIQPGVYTKPVISRFPVSNIGISFQPEKYPVREEVNKNSHIYIEGEEDNVIEPDPYYDEPTQDEIYDPRLTGYGSQSRAYVEPKTGQGRYMYKDIDALRRGNLFTRSNVDHLPFSQQTGVIRDNTNTNIYRAVDESYIDANSQFREGLQQSLMSKRNAELWQLKQYPMRRDQGGCKNIR